jgi:hypothetical protein
MKSIFLKFSAIALALFMTSCLEDDKSPLDPSGVKNVIEILPPSVPASPAGAIYPAYAASFLPSTEAEEYTVTINYSGPEDAAPQDIELEIAVDEQALELYNTHMDDGLYGDAPLDGTTYVMMPEDYYDIDQLTYTIPKGQKSVDVTIKVYPNPETFIIGPSYAVPLRITTASAGILSARNSVAILGIALRNKYDGIYEITGGQIWRFGAFPGGFDAALSGDFDEDITIELVTLTPTTVGIVPVWSDGSTVGGIGGTFLTIDESTNEVTVASTGNATLQNQAAGDNLYLPGPPQGFILNFLWSGGNRRVDNMTLEYVGPRP